MYYLQLLIMVKILTLNVRGIRGLEKQNHLAIYIKRQRADILLLQETNLPERASLPTLHTHTILLTTQRYMPVRGQPSAFPTDYDHT
jgi:exonuclease III